jgi:hypothetical protein
MALPDVAVWTPRERDRTDIGHRGGDAGEAEQGHAGGRIQVTLSSDPSGEPIARIMGECASDGMREPVDAQYGFERNANVELLVAGGQGGDGGDGGTGGDGARGSAGSDATRYSSGGNGGRGGDGGAGGNGSSGTRGGPGGEIVVNVDEKDTHLLMHVVHDVHGGKGGERGRNGAGGAPGSGGAGGSSYSWSETEYYTDSQGNQQSRSVSHYSSGGSSGPSGNPGAAGGAQLRNGAPGKQGRVTFRVHSAHNKNNEYSSRYDLAVTGFVHQNDNDDGIYEPEERVRISQLTVQNVGGMPTPAHHEIIVRVADHGYVAPTDKVLVVPRGLGPGESHTFDEPLELALRVFHPQAPGAPLAEKETLHVACELPDARRSFDDFEALLPAGAGDIVVRFPIELSRLISLFSLAPGQAARVLFSLSNVAEKSFGAAADVGRTLAVRLTQRGGDLTDGGVLVFDERRARVQLDDVGLFREVAALPAKGERTFEAIVAIAADAEPYTTARLLVSAELGHIDSPSQARPIQLQELTVRVGRPFSASPADVLLVVNNRTEKDELAAWETTLRSAGLSSLVWDASLEGGLAVLESAPSFGLVLVLNNEMDTADGPKRPSVMLDKGTSHALAGAGVHVLYVGRSPDLGNLLISTTPPADKVTETRTFAWPWSEPTPAQLEARARSLVQKLAARDTSRRHLVVPRFQPELLKKTLWIRTMKLGVLHVHQTLGAAATQISTLETDEQAMHGPAMSADDGTLALVLSALPFAKKLRLLGSAPLPFGARAAKGIDPIVLAVLSELLAELDAAASVPFRKGVTRAAQRAMLPCLTALTESIEPLASDGDTGARTARLVELLAWLEHLRRDLTRVWEYLPGFLWTRRGPLLRSIVKESVTRIWETAFPEAEARSETRARADARRKELRALLRDQRRQSSVRRTDRELARELFDAARGPRPHASSSDLYPLEDRVLEATKFDAVAAKDEQRHARSKALLLRAKGERERLLLAQRCEELLAAASTEEQEELPPQETLAHGSA